MDLMMEASKSLYPDPRSKNEMVRNTVHLQTANYVQDHRSDLIGRNDQYAFPKGSIGSVNSKEPVSMKNLGYVVRQSSEKDMREFSRTYDNSHQRSSEVSQMSILIDEIKFMKTQQDKILENQNIFQTYISNEITSIKNRINQMESDILLSKTLSSSSQLRSDLGQF